MSTRNLPTRSTPTSYGNVAVLIHWTSAAAVILTFALGWVAAEVLDPPPSALLLTHIAMGILVLALTLLRILWWFAFDRQPSPPEGLPFWQQRTAQIVHLGLYAVLLVMAVSGLLAMLLTGALPLLIAGGPEPEFDDVGPLIAHGLLSKLLLALLVLHIGAALYHHFVRRDGLLARMGAGR